ncbi:LacI family DNA-binding transcriptional regulator [Pontiella sp.]|uniref:LacI family DNA-binding transcriptional regulator n=1 Tax=Pontiella sp. TaxID=2837462 RepID=UPI003563844B
MPNKNANEPPENERHRSVTLRDIAKELGISHVTVSLALRDHPRISAATKLRVQQKADEMGYHPDPMLSALSHYRLSNQEKPVQATLAWINPLQHPGRLLKQEEFSLYWKGAEKVAQRLGFHLEEFRTADLSLPRMDTIFKTRSIRGLLIAPLAWEITPIHWDDFPWKDYAGVRFGRSAQGPLYHFVTSAQVSGSARAFERANQKGYRRIGYFGLNTPRRMFVAGYLRAQQTVPANQQVPPMCYEANDTPEQQQELLAAWLASNRPDAILTDNQLLPSMLHELGYRVPEDIGIATTSIHDTPIDAGINQNPEEIGKAAVRMLVSLINEHHFGIPEVRNQILVDGKWQDGSMLPDRHA